MMSYPLTTCSVPTYVTEVDVGACEHMAVD